MCCCIRASQAGERWASFIGCVGDMVSNDDPNCRFRRQGHVDGTGEERALLCRGLPVTKKLDRERLARAPGPEGSGLEGRSALQDRHNCKAPRPLVASV